MNHLRNTSRLKNRYYVMRHGQSKANIGGIIVSHPKHGTLADYGLTDIGEQQALASAQSCGLSKDTIIYSSDFSRALETAKIAQQVLGAEAVFVTTELRERYFGKLEKTDHSNYHKVWRADLDNPDHTNDEVEATSAVLDRVTGLIIGLEAQHQDKDVLLVSHGDTLQILQTGFQNISSAAHRSLPHLDTAEIRQLFIVR